MSKQQLLSQLRKLTGQKLSQYNAFMQMSTKYIQFKYWLIDILIDLDVQDLVKNRAATFLNYKITKQIKNAQIIDLNELLSFLQKILLNQDILLRNKIIFENSITQYLNNGESQQQSLQILKIINFLLTSQKLQMKMVAPLLYECIAISDIGRLDLIKFYKDTLPSFVKLGSQIMNIIKQLICQKQQLATGDLRQMQINLKYMKHWLNAYKQCFKALNSVYKSNQSCQILSEQCTSNRLIQIFLDIYLLKLNNDKSNCQDMIFSIVKHPIEQYINELKTYVFQINLLMINKYEISECNLFQYDAILINLVQILPKLITSLRQVCRPDFNRDQYQIQGTIVAGLYLLNKAFSFKFLYSRLQKQFKNILLDIVFVLLKISKENLSLFEDSPDEFYKQDYEFYMEKEIKNTAGAARLVFQSIIEIFDGAASFTFYSALGTLKYILKIGPELQIYKQIMLSNYVPTVESCLNILNLMSYKYKKRADLSRQLIAFFKTQQLFELKGIEKSRYLNLLLCNIKQKDDRQLFERYLVWAAKTTEQQKGCINYALQFLSQELRSQMGNQIWYLFISRIQNTKLPSFFKMLQKLISKYQLDLSAEYISQLIDALINRLCIKDFIDQNFDPVIFSSILNLIKQITNCTKQLANNPKIVENVWPIFKLLQNWRTLDFLNDIIQILQNTLKSIEWFSERECSLLQILVQIVDYQNNEYLELLFIIHLYILRSRDLILDNIDRYSEYFSMICEMIERGFSSRNSISIGQSCILYQELIMNYASILNNWDYIKLTTEQMYKNNINCQINTRILNIWLLGYHFYNAFNIEQFFNNWHGFNNYNTKLCVFAVKKIIENNPHHDPSILIQLVKTCSLILHQKRNQQDNSIHMKGKYAKKEGKQNDNRTYFRTTHQYVISELDLPIKKECSSQMLNEIFMYLQKNNPELTEIILEQIQKIMGVRRLKQLISVVQIKNNPRVIVKINRKIFNTS